MNSENVMRRDAPLGRWIWLLPLVYAIHMLEEAFGGGGLVEWMIERGSLRFSIAVFLGLSFLGFAAIAAATWGARRWPLLRWTLACAGTILLVNGVTHVAASVAVRYYVPGLLTGIAFYIPLSAVLLFRVRRLVRPRVFWAAVIAGFVIHAAVLWVVFGAPGL
jgi:hypothetical protein